MNARSWWWGTNRRGGMYYAGRVHVVHPGRRATGLCGLPVEDVWELRPPMPQHMCPDCCVLAMAASYPPFSAPTPATGPASQVTPTGPTRTHPVGPGRIHAAQVPYTDERVTR
jgi:hypothetical protein